VLGKFSNLSRYKSIPVTSYIRNSLYINPLKPRRADYFRGYRDEFSENLYVYPMSEFSREQVSEYFAHPEIDVPLSDEAAESVKF
jgi:hypothetical protein